MSYLLSKPDRGQRILTTLREMLQDRGYTLQKPYAEVYTTLERPDKTAEALKYYDTHETLMTGTRPIETKEGTVQETIEVLNSHEDKLAIGTVRRFLEDYSGKVHTKVVVVIQNITPTAKQDMLSNKAFSLFWEHELYRNRTHHKLYVPHRGLTEAEKQAVLTKYRCKEHNTPSLLRSDPIARYFDFNLGQMVEIQTKYGGTLEPTRSYRIVVERSDLK